MNISFEYSQIGNMIRQLDETSLRLDAVRSFNQAYSRGRRARLLARILRRENRLESLSAQPTTSHSSMGRTVTVPISKIKGSLGRSEDFDASFNPLHERIRARWVSILTAMCQNIPLPPVELVQVGDAYFVQDGHHRISVARSLQQEAIEACIVA